MTYPETNSAGYHEWEYPEHECTFITSSVEGAYSGGKQYLLEYCTQCDVRKFVEAE